MLGLSDGAAVGTPDVGVIVGSLLGCTDGVRLGPGVGASDGAKLGEAEGVADGVSVLSATAADGKKVGVDVGARALGLEVAVDDDEGAVGGRGLLPEAVRAGREGVVADQRGK
jgi:hypothetical protein